MTRFVDNKILQHICTTSKQHTRMAECHLNAGLLLVTYAWCAYTPQLASKTPRYQLFVKILDTAYATEVKNATVTNGLKEW